MLSLAVLHPPSRPLRHGPHLSPATTHTTLVALEPSWLQGAPSAHGSYEAPCTAPNNTEPPCPTLLSSRPALEGSLTTFQHHLLRHGVSDPPGWKGPVGSEGPQATMEPVPQSVGRNQTRGLGSGMQSQLLSPQGSWDVGCKSPGEARLWNRLALVKTACIHNCP